MTCLQHTRRNASPIFCNRKTGKIWTKSKTDIISDFKTDVQRAKQRLTFLHKHLIAIEI